MTDTFITIFNIANTNLQKLWHTHWEKYICLYIPHTDSILQLLSQISSCLSTFVGSSGGSNRFGEKILKVVIVTNNHLNIKRLLIWIIMSYY